MIWASSGTPQTLAGFCEAPPEAWDCHTAAGLDGSPPAAGVQEETGDAGVAPAACCHTAAGLDGSPPAAGAQEVTGDAGVPMEAGDQTVGGEAGMTVIG